LRTDRAWRSPGETRLTTQCKLVERQAGRRRGIGGRDGKRHYGKGKTLQIPCKRAQLSLQEFQYMDEIFLYCGWRFVCRLLQLNRKSLRQKKRCPYFNPVSEANISTSKIVLLFSLVVAVCWGTLLLKHFKIIPLFCQKYDLTALVSIAATMLLAALPGRMKFLHSDISNHEILGRRGRFSNR
jgi:hypothetical protein